MVLKGLEDGGSIDLALNLQPPTSNLQRMVVNLRCLLLQEWFKQVDGYGKDRSGVLFRGHLGQGL